VAAHTTPESFDNGELTVKADSDTWATQVRLLTPQILTRLAEELGAATVTHLRVRGPASKKRGNVRPR
jgi:predicted nucleic acid-binding Zn ribbon protein